MMHPADRQTHRETRGVVLRLAAAAVVWALVLWLAGGPHAAAAVEILPPADTRLELTVDRGRLIRLPSPAESVFLAEPDVADVQVKSPTLIYVFGEKAGETTLYAVGPGDTIVAGIGIVVTQDLAALRLALDSVGLGDTIEIARLGTGVVLTGTVASAAEAQQAVSLVEAIIKPEKPISRLRVLGANQVNLRVRVAEVSRDVLKQFGINWEGLFNTGDFLVGLATGRPFLTGNGQFVTRPTTGSVAANSVFGSISQGNLDLNFMIDALDDEGLVSVLAEPNLTARSGQKAEFLAGGEFPILVPQSDDQITVEYKQFGVQLSFTPIVLDDGRISIEVAPEVSQLVTTNSVTLDNFVVPALSKRSAETTVELGSGQSFAIAGLIQNTLDHDVQKFPGLGDLPILGALFRSDTFQRGETELVIIITPYLVRPVSDPTLLADPFDGYRPATDLDRLLYGRNYDSRIAMDDGADRAGASGGRNLPGQTLFGPAGFILE